MKLPDTTGITEGCEEPQNARRWDMVEWMGWARRREGPEFSILGKLKQLFFNIFGSFDELESFASLEETEVNEVSSSVVM